MFLITFQNNNNYGAFLQMFALQKKLDLANMKVFDYRPSCISLHSLYLSNKIKKRLPFFWHIIALGCYFLKRKQNKFIENKKIRKTRRLFSIKKIKENKQTLVVGSDQVWNPYCIHYNILVQNIDVYFLNFGSDSAKRISYAASLGMKKWPKDFEQRVLPMLQRFDAISVREESSVPYLTSLGLKNVVCVCDPTILHEGDLYREQFPATKVYKEEYAFVYKIREQIPKAVQETFPNKVITVDLQKRKSLVSVTDWLSYIDNAKFVVTDSFHCAVFCILFHKPFLVIPNQSTGKGMNERFATLLGKTSLEYRCLSCEESTEQVLEKLNSPIDWNHVDAVLEEWRTYSANWLKNALEN